MYLTEEAISSSLKAVRDFSAPGSQLAFTYFTRAALERPSVGNRLLGRLVERLGEPYTFGFDPASLSDFLGARGFTLGEDRSAHSWAQALLPPDLVASLNRAPSRIALAERAG
jgi:O-methyltransferase involved in polyketide biosynthesis